MKLFLCTVTITLTACLASGSLFEEFKRLHKEESENLNKKCGTTFLGGYADSSVYRVSFGETTKQGEFPWEVLVLFKIGENWQSCSGTIISKYHVVTAAHCFITSQSFLDVLELDIEKSFIVGGSPCAESALLPYLPTSCKSEAFKKPKELHISRIFAPRSSFALSRKQNTSSGTNEGRVLHPDLAILVLESPIDDSDDQLSPICVPTKTTSTPLAFTAYGFGTTEKEVLVDRILRNVQLWKLILVRRQLRFFRKCVKGTTNVRECEIIIRGILGDNQGSMCPGDSGGALSGVINRKHYLFGVLSTSRIINCDAMKARNMENTFTALWLGAFGDFLCFYAGVCPLGYDTYADKKYEEHPAPVLLLSRDDYKNFSMKEVSVFLPEAKKENAVPEPEIIGTLQKRMMARD